MATDNQEQVAKEITIALLNKYSKMDVGIDRATELIGKSYSQILEAVVKASRGN
ncbi:hypothetical protein ACE3MQ_19950 [Paenibacillus lentus]|uniref:hypothetical protein n=1 Tax=Paenibacillus lentus TaxID=1338368 RepID=UPI00365D40F9